MKIFKLKELLSQYGDDEEINIIYDCCYKMEIELTRATLEEQNNCNGIKEGQPVILVY